MIEINAGRGTAPSTDAYPPESIPALTRLLDGLAAERIRYCLWKSNLRLHQALSGHTDLDLLVDRRDGARFRDVLSGHPVKPIVAARAATYPGVEHFLGFDAGTGRLFHLHVHFQMVLGQQYVKNHRVPLEHEFLGATRTLDRVPVPAAALELGVLCARALLKYRARDFVKDALGIRSPGLAADIRDEIAWLLRQTSREEVRAALEDAGDVLPSALISEFLEIAASAPRSGYRLFRLRAELRRSIEGMQRHGRARAGAAYLRSAWRDRRRLRFRARRDGRMSPAGGGFTAALVGADGAGKSTLANALAGWLGWKLQAQVFYMGSKQPSRLSDWLYLAFRAQRRAGRAVARAALLRPLAGAVDSARDVTLALHHLSIGRDRVRRYSAAVGAAAGGAVVIFDRFPLEGLSRDPGARLLDGPQIASILGHRANRWTRALARREERMYGRFRLPDYLFALQVSPRVSADRKPDHAPGVIEAKSRAVLELTSLASRRRIASRVFPIDADRPYEEVLLDVQKRLWDVL